MSAPFHGTPRRALPALFAAALLGSAGGAWAQASPAPWTACGDAAAAAEQAAGIPPGLLLAIGKVESGRADPGTGRVTPWPYAVNVAGAGRHFADRAAAIGHVRQAQAAGARSIDVGCFQVNLLHHPGAFATLDNAFDPALNAGYAARFLAGLRASAGSWEVAAGQYHSLTAGFAEPYAARVLATWSGLAARPASPLVRVYGPAGLVPTAGPAPRFTAMRRLPVVYVPMK